MTRRKKKRVNVVAKEKEKEDKIHLSVLKDSNLVKERTMMNKEVKTAKMIRKVMKKTIKTEIKI